jgi:hypothetical protein
MTKISKIDIFRYALWGVRTEIGANTGNPLWTEEDFEALEKIEKELERRLKLAKIADAKRGSQK